MSNLKLTINLLPKGAWGNNLRERLSQKEWDILRNVCYEKAKLVCTICGKSDEQLEAHEVWDFNIEAKTQTLKDIIALCTACHGVKHIRNSQRIGYGEHAKAHFLKVNKSNELAFATHFTKAQMLFEEQSKVLRWELKTDLDKFGGHGMEIKERYIPIIDNPYESVDWTTVRHTKIDSQNSKDLVNLNANAIILQPYATDNNGKLSAQNGAVYFVRKTNALPPKICSIVVDNYSGEITVASDRVNKIQWISENLTLKTKYNFGGKFITKFSVEDLRCSDIRFILNGSGGETISDKFRLSEAL